MPDPEHTFSIGRPPAHSQRMALERAFEFLPPWQRKQAEAEVMAAAARGERSLDGLFAAWRRDEVVCALWTELHPGESATLFAPQTADGVPKLIADDLLTNALAWLESRSVELVQCVLATDTGEDAERLQRAGFEHPCDLLCLISEAGQFPTTAVAASLAFERVAPEGLDNLAELVEQTYENTLDCPALDARRDCRQVLAGYRATCRDDLSHWFLVRRENRPIGCLLLGHDASGLTWELVYMGLLPDVRGQGFGLEIVRRAQWLVAQQKGERLLLAVDAANEPALRVYAAAGFTVWDRRSVYLKMLSPA
jgi:ribosomal protein S18 acetylase RimI-like enzyme